jgi:hypothetical protein
MHISITKYYLIHKYFYNFSRIFIYLFVDC